MELQAGDMEPADPGNQFDQIRLLNLQPYSLIVLSMKNKYIRTWAFVNIGLFIILLLIELFKTERQSTRILAIVSYVSLFIFCIASVFLSRKDKKSTS